MAGTNYQITMRSGPTPGKTYPLRQEETLLGRDLANDIVINDAEVSRRHARLILREGSMYAEDLGSTNGTFLNGERISGAQELRPGDVITLGDSIVLAFEKISYDPDVTPVPGEREDAVPVQQPPYEKPAPEPEVYQPVPEPRPYKQPEPDPMVDVEELPDEEDLPEKREGLPTWLIIMIIAIVVLVCVIAVTMWFMPASWWCAITFDQLPGCPVP